MFISLLIFLFIICLQNFAIIIKKYMTKYSTITVYSNINKNMYVLNKVRLHHKNVKRVKGNETTVSEVH